MSSGTRTRRATGCRSTSRVPVARSVAGFFEALQGLEFTRFQPLNFLIGGNQVAVTVDLAATVKDTGRPIEVLEIHLWTFGEDGKVTRFFHAVDRHAFVDAYRVTA